MCRDLADITIKISGIDSNEFDYLIEELENQDLKYEIIKVENQRTEGDNQPDPHDVWVDHMIQEGKL